jgi:hypothetical protein
MADPDRPGDLVPVPEQSFQLGDLARRLGGGEAGAVDDGDARGVVAALFQPTQPLHEEGDRVTPADEHDLAHGHAHTVSPLDVHFPR